MSHAGHAVGGVGDGHQHTGPGQQRRHLAAQGRRREQQAPQAERQHQRRHRTRAQHAAVAVGEQPVDPAADPRVQHRVEQAAIVEMLGLGIRPTPEAFIDRHEPKLRQAVEIGNTYILPEVRGTGLNGRIKRLLLDRAFACGIRRVEFRIDEINARSQAAVRKIGGVKEGVLRAERITWTGRVRDTGVFSILVDEWKQ